MLFFMGDETVKVRGETAGNMPSSVAKCIFPPLWILLAVFACVVAGCGVKGPPVPPTHESLPGVTLMSAQTTDNYVTLTWQLEDVLGREDATAAVFVVLESKNPVDAPLCDTCPIIFERAATLSYTDAPDRQFSIELPVDSGYQYRFKIRLESGSTARTDSGVLEVETPGPLPEQTPLP